MEESKWISVKDRLPEETEWVLCSKNGSIMVMCAQYSNKSKGFYFYGDSCPDPNVSYWMPLPEPPKVLA